MKNKCNKSSIVQIVAAGGGNRLPARPKTPVFREAQKHVQAMLEKKWLTKFLKTPEYKSQRELIPQRGKGKMIYML